jgi:tetratricopeptide (TPR) repeat protein
MKLGRLKALLLATLAFVVIGADVRSETPEGLVPDAAAYESSEAIHQPVRFDPFAKLDNHYYSALGAVNRGDYSEAANQFELLLADAKELAIESLPIYSEQLLHLAQSVEGEREVHEIRFLVNHAVELSPEDPRTLFGAIRFRLAIGNDQAWEYFGRGLAAAWDYPSVILGVGRNVVFTFLVALTLSLFLVCIIQLVSHRLSLLRGLGLMFPLKWRGLLSGPLFLLCLFVPLVGGPVIAAALWALLLGRYVKDCAGLGLLAGVLLLCWVPTVVLVERIDSTANSAITRVVESAEKGGHVASTPGVVKLALARHGADVRLLFAAGVWAMRQKDYEQAGKFFQFVLDREDERSGYALASKNNLALAKFLTKEFAQSKKLLSEVMDASSPSVDQLFLMARLQIAMMDADKHREFFAQANELDPARVSELEADQEVLGDVLVQSLPWELRYRRLLSPVFGNISGEPFMEESTEGRALLRVVTNSSDPISAGVVGLLVLLLGLAVYFRPARVRATEARLLQCELGVPSMIWILMPGGYFIRGKYVVAGVFVIAVIICLVVFAFNAPVAMLNVLPVEIINKESFLWTALVFTIGAAVVSMVIHPFEKRSVV